MSSFESAYKNSSFGYAGRIPFSLTTVAYFAPLLDDNSVTVDNSISGDTTDYNVTSRIHYPLLFTVTATADCRVRIRTLHPSFQTPTTAQIFAKMDASAGYTVVPASTDVVQYATLPVANVGNGTTTTAQRVFNTIRTGTYGTWLPAGSQWPVIVTSQFDTWIQVIARDGDGTATSGSLLWSCSSDLNIVGY